MVIRSLWKIKNLILSLLKKKTIGVRALVIHDDQVLLVKHTYIDGWYSIGGGVDWRESPLKALKRELYEEVGITCTTPPSLFSAYYNSYEGRDDYILFYIVTNFTQVNVTSCEILEAQWFSLSDLPQDISPATQRRVQEFLKEKDISDHW